MQKARNAQSKGAEAFVEECVFFGHPAVSKTRLPKAYRIPAIDSSLRRRRTICEARLLSAAKEAGALCPLLYFVDLAACRIIEEKLEGELLSRASLKRRESCAADAGKLLGKLHSAGIYHGDYTTTNLMICADGNLRVIDFGLSERSFKPEDFATDLLLYKKSVGKKEFGRFLLRYGKANPNAKQALLSLREIEMRGRYVSRGQ